MTPDLEGALRIFVSALAYANHADRLAEVKWQREVSFHEFSESDVLREAAWVILCSGFRERIVRRVFDHISLCFCDWESAAAILAADPTCRTAAMASFRNRVKLSAIVGCARHINHWGFAAFKDAVLADPIPELQRLPHIGPVTAWHLAKNLGCDVAKPDRHLARVSFALGFHDTDHFCTDVAKASGERKNVIDLIVWRYLANNPHALRAVT